MSHDAYPFKLTSSSPYYSWLLPGISWLFLALLQVVGPLSWSSSFLALHGSFLVLPGPVWLLPGPLPPWFSLLALPGSSWPLPGPSLALPGSFLALLPGPSWLLPGPPLWSSLAFPDGSFSLS
ncbi:uncharacterized protein BJ212DRAFT_1484656 [Suillus subaureus]|uniref:Uncharacterized protein n=1 Tax=Suillus subaureus TaxID=48587 RepID=A0A9P7J958_9AGAM|nr:uncharacterized protein BJ212DRAFT_1484656 [Suillus subaureus]KAG1809149.1 hypothetical protein BJ212DRAFT_1484656 [Suillus subaureus]